LNAIAQEAVRKWTRPAVQRRPAERANACFPFCYDEVDMFGGPASPERELMRQWVDTWRRAGAELAEIRRHEIESADTQEAVRQLFGTGVSIDSAPPRTTSGLVEQQAWFARFRRANLRP
ncbi:MAG TPA: hypothetical protein VKJ01_05995, partial [Candidatus Solibacter sp.]|nr:hypothetical protein [Candidatus Solibacter sp.]